MTDPESRQNKNWPDLTKRARQSTAPELDVAAPVLAALRRLPRETPGTSTLSDEIAALFARAWFKPVLAALLLVAGGLAYEEYRSSDDVSFLFELSL